METNYYKNQLNQIKIDPIYPPNIRIHASGLGTNWMDINKESAKELIEWLNTNFINK